MEITGEILKQKASEHNITKWDIHNCSLCGYQCGFIFRGGEAYYDSGCDCTGSQNIQARSWDAVAGRINMQKNEGVINEYKEFWHIEDRKEQG